MKSRCRAVFLHKVSDGSVCQLHPGHKGAHVDVDFSWTDHDAEVADQAWRSKKRAVFDFHQEGPHDPRTR